MFQMNVDEPKSLADLWNEPDEPVPEQTVDKVILSPRMKIVVESIALSPQIVATNCAVFLVAFAVKSITMHRK